MQNQATVVGIRPKVASEVKNRLESGTRRLSEVMGTLCVLARGSELTQARVSFTAQPPTLTSILLSVKL